MVFFPHLGATQMATAVQPTMTTPAYDRNPGAMTSFFMSWIVATADCSGALMTMTTDPTMQLKQPTLPTKLRRSLRNMADRIAVTTTDRAPMGVTKMASTKAYATKLQTSPMIINVMPVHHIQLRR